MFKSILQSGKRTTALFLVVFAMIFGTASVTYAASSGGWVSKQYQVNGAWEIFKRDGQTIIKLSDSFQTNAGPDLKLFLSKTDISDLTGKNATQNATFVSKLKSPTGSQEYVLPEEVDINDYTSLLIHCVKFSVLWGGSNI